MYRIDVENLPKDGPVLLNVNHPGAFLDACVISAYSPRPLYYLTRGDFFKKGIATAFLKGTHQIPIYRGDHGIKQLRNNKETFDYCYDNLHEGNVLLIFPEARAEVEKRLRPLHKGASRILFGTYEKYGIIPAMVPVGFTFSEPRYFGYDVFYRYGKPVSIEKHLELYKTDPQRAYQLVTEEIKDGLRNVMIYLETKEGEAVFDDAVRLLEVPPPAFPPVSGSTAEFDWQRELANHINSLDEGELSTLQATIDKIQSAVGSIGLNLDVYPSLEDKHDGLFGLLLAAPVRLVGAAIGAVPAWVTYKFFINKVKRDPFIGPIKSMLGFFVHAFYFMFIGIALIIAFGSMGYLLTIGAAMLVYFALQQHRRPHLLHWIKWQAAARTTREDLKKMRQDLRKALILNS